MSLDIKQHNLEIQKNLEAWNEKPLLREIYKKFYEIILKWLRNDLDGKTVEIGSGIGNFKSIYPECIATDIFPNPWIDQVESAYHLSFKNGSVSNIILFDVFHHLASPGSALNEFKRVLKDKGRVIIFEPNISLFGAAVYGLFHHEPINFFKKIEWLSHGKNPDENYYAAQGNATRIFSRNSKWKKEIVKDWNVIHCKKSSALSYVLSGGFSKRALYPFKLLPIITKAEKFLDLLPFLFATRMIVVLEKKSYI